jgi:hypothetical protein
MAESSRSLWDKTWRDRHGRVVLWQTPNASLIAWVVLTLISLFSSSHTVQKVFWWGSVTALLVWSFLETWHGVNYFRRALGAVILLMTIGAAFGVGL